MVYLNISNITIENVDCAGLASSYYFFNQTRKVNIFLSVFIIIIGLIGNSIQAAVFLHKKFRTNSSSIYLLSMSLSDGLFLMLHFFEDTIRTYQDVYLSTEKIMLHPNCPDVVVNNTNNQNSFNEFVKFLNITDR